MILKSDALKRINILREEIREHNFNYYTLADPKISDLEFDKLLQELISLENNFPEFFLRIHQLKELAEIQQKNSQQ